MTLLKLKTCRAAISGRHGKIGEIVFRRLLAVIHIGTVAQPKTTVTGEIKPELDCAQDLWM